MKTADHWLTLLFQLFSKWEKYRIILLAVISFLPACILSFSYDCVDTEQSVSLMNIDSGSRWVVVYLHPVHLYVKYMTRLCFTERLLEDGQNTCKPALSQPDQHRWSHYSALSWAKLPTQPTAGKRLRFARRDFAPWAIASYSNRCDSHSWLRNAQF